MIHWLGILTTQKIDVHHTSSSLDQIIGCDNFVLESQPNESLVESLMSNKYVEFKLFGGLLDLSRGE
jgi:hypothetical protein